MVRHDSVRRVHIAVERGVNYLTMRGVEWFGLFRSDVGAISRKRRGNHTLLSDAWFLIGELHFCNGARRASLRSYLRSISFWRQNSAAWAEAGARFAELGNEGASRDYLTMALLLNKFDVFARAELNELDSDEVKKCADEMRTMTSPELLALGRFEEAKQWGADDQVANVLGAAGQTSDELSYWCTKSESTDSRIDNKDQFFLSEETWNNSEFWRSLTSKKNLNFISFDFFASHDYFGPLGIARGLRSQVTKEFHLARTLSDKRALWDLSVAYPDWRYPRKTIQFIETFGRSPTRQELFDIAERVQKE